MRNGHIHEIAPAGTAAPRADEDLAASLPVAVAVLRAADAVVLSVNPAWERLFGHTQREVVGMRYSAFTVPAQGSPPRRASQITEALDGDGRWSGEVESVRKDGTTFWTATELCRYDAEAHGETWLLVQSDITPRHAGEAERGQAAARWRSAFDDAPVGMAIIGPDLRMTDVNARLCALTGYGRADLIGTSLPTLLHPDDVAPDAELGARLRAGELDRYRAHERIVDAHGRTIPVEVWMTIARAPDGRADHELAIMAER